MSLIRTIFRVVNCIITLGGSIEVEDANEEYQAAYSAYLVTHNSIADLNASIEDSLKDIGDKLAVSRMYLDKAQSALKTKAVSLTANCKANVALYKLHRFNSSYNGILSTGFGGIVGGSTAVGAWALVSVLGSASTGTAIAGLSGVAATNATLAWFGGGALAAGGAGMSGGMMVLGGIVAAPIVFFATRSSYRKADKIRAETQKVTEENLRLQEILLELKQQCEQTLRYREYINGICHEFVRDFHESYEILYPWGFVSKLKQSVLVLFKKDPHNKQQKVELQKLIVATDRFLSAFDAGNK